MAKNKIDYKKSAIVGIIWTVAYTFLVVYYVYHDLGFNLLSADQWSSTYIAFNAGVWAIDSTESVLLALTVLLFFPVWIIGWYSLYKVNWHFNFLHKKKEINFKRELILTPKNSKLQAPVKLRLQNHQFTSMVRDEDTPISQKTADTSRIIATKDVVVDEADKQAIIQLAAHYNADPFQDVVLEGSKIPLAISTDETAVLIVLLNTVDASWVADDQDVLSDWYSDTIAVPSPAAFVKNAANILQNLEQDSNVIPVIVITRGTLLGADDIVRAVEAEGIKLLRYGEGTPDTLGSLEDFLDNTFERKEK